MDGRQKSVRFSRDMAMSGRSRPTYAIKVYRMYFCLFSAKKSHTTQLHLLFTAWNTWRNTKCTIFFLWRVSDLHLFLLLLVDTLLLCHLHRLSLFFLCYIFFTCFNVNFLLSQDFATPLSIVCYMTIIIVQESLTANNLLWLNVSSKCIGYWPCCVACLQNFFL